MGGVHPRSGSVPLPPWTWTLPLSPPHREGEKHRRGGWFGGRTERTRGRSPQTSARSRRTPPRPDASRRFEGCGGRTRGEQHRKKASDGKGEERTCAAEERKTKTPPTRNSKVAPKHQDECPEIPPTEPNRRTHQRPQRRSLRKQTTFLCGIRNGRHETDRSASQGGMETSIRDASSSNQRQERMKQATTKGIVQSSPTSSRPSSRFECIGRVEIDREPRDPSDDNLALS